MKSGHLELRFSVYIFLISPVNHPIIVYQLTKFEVPIYNSFWDIFFTIAFWPLQRDMTPQR